MRSVENSNIGSNDIDIDKDTVDNRSGDNNNHDAYKSPTHATRRVGHQWFETRVRGCNVNNVPITFTFQKIKEWWRRNKCGEIEHETSGAIVKDDTGSYGVSFAGYDCIYIVPRSNLFES